MWQNLRQTLMVILFYPVKNVLEHSLKMLIQMGLQVQELLGSFPSTSSSSPGQHGDAMAFYQPGLHNLFLLASWLLNLSLNLDPSHRR